jgi:hypothetical protein
VPELLRPGSLKSQARPTQPAGAKKYACPALYCGCGCPGLALAQWASGTQLAASLNRRGRLSPGGARAAYVAHLPAGGLDEPAILLGRLVVLGGVVAAC